MGLYGLPPLQSDQIRLLRVTLEKFDKIQCAITVHDLCYRTLEFSALSYTWGPCQRCACDLRRPASSTDLSRAASCNQQRDEVTENLYDSLYEWGSSHDGSAYLGLMRSVSIKTTFPSAAIRSTLWARYTPLLVRCSYGLALRMSRRAVPSSS